MTVVTTMQQNALADSSIQLAKHASQSTLDRMRTVLKTYFPANVQSYCEMEIEDYRARVSEVQDLFSNENYTRAITGEILPALSEYLHGERFLIQTNLYLRASRPVTTQTTEAVGWHRETFYGSNMEQAINIWTPLDGVEPENTLRYIPYSQHIPDSNILITKIEDEVTKRFSTGHKIGFVYAPKIIIGGVDLSNSVPMNVPTYSSSIFSGNLIHGAAANHSKSIRFSVDFRILPMTAWDEALSKSFHFASGKPYFEEY